MFCKAWLYWLLPIVRFFKLTHCCAHAFLASQVFGLFTPYSSITPIFKAPLQVEFIKPNTYLPSPTALPGIPCNPPSLKSNLFTIASNLKGAKRISNCPVGAPPFLLLLSQGLSILLFTWVRAATTSPFTVRLLAPLLNQFFTKSETCASVAMCVGSFDASCFIIVLKVHGPLIFPF